MSATRHSMWAVGLGALLACSRTEPPGGAAPSAPEAGAPAASTSGGWVPVPDPGDATPAIMKLLDPGRSPRRVLRYAWRPGQNETLTLDLKTSASTDDGTTKQPEILLPPVHIVLAIEPRDVSATGDMTYAWRVTSTAVKTDPQTPSSLADGMRAEVTAIAHLSGSGVVSSRGLSSRVTVEVAATMDGGATGQMVEQVRQTLRDAAAAFPEEEVGAGARWEKLSQLASRDTRVTQTETFTLANATGDSGSLDDILAQTAPPQPLLTPGAAGGAHARIESMLASGTGKTRFELTRFIPQTTFEGTTTMVVSGRLPPADDPGGQRMTMIMRVGIVLAGTLN
jgi:hypothetical protein